MKTIYELQQIANRLRQVMEVNSISPEDTFGLQSDVLEYLADMEQNAEGLGIHKVYASYAAMVADASSPVGSNGKALRFGQLVVICNPSNTIQEENGNIYAWQKGNAGDAAWLLIGNLGSVLGNPQNGYYVCDTAAATAEKEITATGYVLSVGGSMKVKMTNANTADNATLNINSTGVKALYYAGERASSINTWEAGETVEVYYDGTSYYANNVAGGSGSGDGAFDVSAKYPTSGVDGSNTYTLGGALAVLNANLSANKKKGGMSIKFIQSSDNKYVQYRLMATSFSATESDWQGIDVTPVKDSHNLVESGGVYNEIDKITSTEDWRKIDTNIVENLIFVQTVGYQIANNGSYKIAYKSVSVGEKVHYRTNSSERIYIAFTTSIPALNVVTSGNDYYSNGQNNKPREITSTVDGYFCLCVKKEYSAEFVEVNTSIAKRLGAIEPIVVKNAADILNLGGRLIHVEHVTEGLYNKDIAVTQGAIIYDNLLVNRISVDIKKGETFKCKVVDTENLLSFSSVGAFAYFKNGVKGGTLIPAGIVPNEEYTFVAPQDIDGISFGRNGEYVSGTGNVVLRVIQPSSFDRLQSQITEQGKEIDDITSTDEYKEIDGTLAAGLIVSGTQNKLLINTNYKTIYIPVSVGDTVRYSTDSTETLYVGFCAQTPANNVAIKFYDYWSSGGGGIVRSVESNVNGYFCVSVKNTYEVSYYEVNDSIERRLELVEEEVFGGESDYELDCAGHIFGVYNGVNGKEYFSAIYPEGLTNHILPIRINEKKKALIQSLCGSTLLTAAETTESKTFKIKGKGYQEKQLSLTYHKVNAANAKNKNIHILTIGDSIRALITGLTSDDTDMASWAGWMKRMSIENNATFGNISLNFIGTTNEETGAYEGVSYKVYGEGRGGWATYAYTNWPREQRFYDPTNPTTRFNAEEGYYALGLATKTPYCSNVAGQSWVDFSNSDLSHQKDVICTPFGRFKPDYCAALWDGCKKYSAFTGTGDWSDTAENRAKIDALFTLWVNDAQSPFFDIDHARAHTGTDDSPVWTNPSGFSIAKYLERYRTCDDLGVTLVGSAGETVTGSDGNSYTIGTKVTNTSAYNVCTPTHIIEMLGTNDANSNFLNRIECQKGLLVELTNYGVKTGYFIPRRVGVFYPQDWQEEGMTREISSYWLAINYSYVTGIRQYIGSLDSSKIVNYIPVYNTMSPFGSAYVTKKCVDMDYADNVKLLTGTDDLHPNGVQLRSIALQALGWLYWSEM